MVEDLIEILVLILLGFKTYLKEELTNNSERESRSLFLNLWEIAFFPRASWI